MLCSGTSCHACHCRVLPVPAIQSYQTQLKYLNIQSIKTSVQCVGSVTQASVVSYDLQLSSLEGLTLEHNPKYDLSTNPKPP